MSKRIELMVEVDGIAGLPGPQRLAATAWLPAQLAGTARPLAMFAFPGAGYARQYFDLQFAEHADYSQAGYHAARGAIFFAIDHLGAGASSIPDLKTLSLEQMAQANAKAVEALCRMLAAGSLDPEFPPLANPLRIGIGQSMGGCIAILMQAQQRCFDGLAVLGYSVMNFRLMRRPDSQDQGGAPSFEDFVYGFHWDEEPQEIVQADVAGGIPKRKAVPYFGSATTPHCVLRVITPGAIEAEAGRVEAPLFLGYGERDVSAAPHRDPAAFPRCRDLQLHILPRMAHMHNFAPGRQRLWGLLQEWAQGLERG